MEVTGNAVRPLYVDVQHYTNFSGSEKLACTVAWTQND